MADAKYLGAGLYSTGRTLEVDVPQALREFGWEDTEANGDKVEDLITDVIKENGLLAPTGKIQYRHNHRCRCGRVWQHEGRARKCPLGRKAFCRACRN